MTMYNYYSYYLRIKYCTCPYLVQVLLFQKHSFKSEKNQGKPMVIYQFDHPRREFEPSGAILYLTCKYSMDSIKKYFKFWTNRCKSECFWKRITCNIIITNVVLKCQIEPILFSNFFMTIRINPIMNFKVFFGDFWTFQFFSISKTFGLLFKD